MNPIKSPQEMLYQEAGVPSLASGGAIEKAIVKLSPGAEQLFKTLSKKLSGVLGRAPTAEELSQLHQEVHGLASPTSSMEGANLARVAKQEPYANMFANSEGRVYPPTAEGQLPTPGQRKYQGYDQAFDNRDEFLTQMNLGRGNRGTWLHASPESDISDEASLLNQMDTGTELGGHPMQSTTPANDYIAQLADAMQASGVKHDYTGLGPAVFGDRPNLPATTLTKAQKAELEAWRDQARQAALPEDAITSAPSRLGKDYQYLEEERNLGSTGPEASMGGYADGGGVLGKYFGHGLGALGALPDTIEAGRLALAGKFLPAAGSATEAASTFLPLPAMAAYMGMKPTELGDDTLAGWKAQELARKQKNINDQ